MDAGLDTFLVFAGIAAAFGVGSIFANRMLGAKRRRSYLQAHDVRMRRGGRG